MSKIGGDDSKNPLYCSFCGKSQHEVRKLIAGPTVFICNECVELCREIGQQMLSTNMSPLEFTSSDELRVQLERDSS